MNGDRVNGNGVTGEREIFDRRVAGALTWGVLGAVMVTLFFLVFSEAPPEVEPGGADSYSRSALGYEALVRLLEEEVPVLVSRGNSAAKTSRTVPLLLLEPPGGEEGLAHLAEQVVEAAAREATVVLVLPKWRGEPSRRRPGWVGWVELLPAAEVQAALQAALGSREGEVELLRPSSAGPWSLGLGPVPPETAGEPPAPALPRPQLLAAGSPLLEPVMAAPQGLLVARVTGTALLLVSDPDLLNTAGLARGDNALLVHRLLVDHLQPSSLVVDEELHGYEATPSVWRALLRFPLLPVSLHLALTAAWVLWAGTGRFGRPLEPEPRLAPGKGTLIDNSARLLGVGAGIGRSLDQYLETTVRRAARAAALPPHLDFRGQVRELSRIASNRGVERDLEALRRAVVTSHARLEPRRALALARGLYLWRKETMDGTLPDP